MKKIRNLFTLILVSLISIGGLNAQAPQNRTASTIVADVLAQLPADTQKQYNQLMGDLVETGEEGLLLIINNINEPGPKSNEQTDFALSGWTNFVAKDEAKRLETSNAYAKALSLPLHDETKAFIIRQLERIANNDQIDVLSSYLSNERLSGPASRALVAIGTTEADNALIKGLEQATDEDAKTKFVNAILQTKSTNVEDLLLNTLRGATTPNLKKTTLKALSKFGTASSLKDMKKAVSDEKYAYGKESVTASYIEYLNTLSKIDPKLAQKEANNLLKTAQKQKQADLQTAAMDLLMNVPAENKTKLLEYALKDRNPSLVANTLRMYPNSLEKKEYDMLIKQLNSASPETQVPIIYWLGDNNMGQALPEIAKFTKSEDPFLRAAAIRSLAKFNNEEAMLQLAGLLKSNDPEVVKLAKDALTTYKGDISYVLASVFNDSNNDGKRAILQLIAERRMESQYNLVYNQLFNSNDVIKAEAAKTLRYVTTEKNLSDLFVLIEKPNAEYVPELQNAINAALTNLPEEQQMALINERISKPGAQAHLYYPAVAQVGTQEAMDKLVEYYQESDNTNKNAAFKALASLESFDAIYPILDIARSNEDKGAAIDAIINIIAKSDQKDAVRYLFLREALEMSKSDEQKGKIIDLLGKTNMYQALLLLEPYLEVPAVKEKSAQALMTLALDNPSFAGTKTTTILNKVSSALNNPDAGYQREAINKYLNENKDRNKNDFVKIFNEKDLTGWKGLVANPIKRANMSAKELATAQAKADKEAAESWIVEDGELVFTGKGDNLCTVKQYGDFEMLVDWKLYPGKEPDAGIYLRGTPQVQIWDIARTNVGAEVGSGGLYNNKTHESKPLKVADLKLGEWNTFYIKMVGDRVTVYLNGELVTDNVILENFWDRNLPIFAMEQIELQAHGSKVAYRDIYVREIDRPKPFTLSEEEKKENFEVLFDGTNMHEWTGNTKDYIIEDGNIVIYPSKSYGGNLYTKREFDNFVFRFEFQLTPGANNGLGIRAPLEGDAAYLGMELQILDNDAPIYKKLKEHQYHGSVYGVIPAKRGFLKPVGEWNYQEVIADGDHIKIILNGETILDGNIREASKNGTETIDGRDHPGLLNKTGHIGFLGHGSVVKFRNIRVKQL